MDFSNYPLSNRYYGGSEKKIGIIINGSPYMLKFQKNTAFGLRSNHISEYIGSHVFALLGFPTQETYLGTYRGEQVVACKDFIEQGVQFVPFNDVGERSLDQDKERYQYSYDDIIKMLQDNSKLTQVEETIHSFWVIYIVDALLGNFDRHGSNWGFIKKNNAYSLAPVFDNGSCLFPNMDDEIEMETVMNSDEETKKRVFTFPTSQILLNGKISSYYEVIRSCAFPECNSALKAVCKKLDLYRVYTLIDNTPLISETHKRFYKHMLSARYELMIKASYDLLERITDESSNNDGNNLP
ncbi:MAG: HipA domain-containing protein [Clostridiaceae bacterium]|nr:HipA domain-containing protein [Clostridiaceae bacterium]